MRDRAAIDIGDVLRQAELAQDGERHGRERLVDSTRSTSLKFQRARSNACCTAGTGPMPNIPGSTAATP